MVKVTFNSSLAQKSPTKQCTDEALIPTESQDEEGGPVRPRRSRLGCWCLGLGVALVLLGVAMGSYFLFRPSYVQFWCGVIYLDYEEMEEVEDLDPSAEWHRIQENIRVLDKEGVALIDVPAPGSSDSNPANIVHDFNQNTTVYLDLVLNKCYVAALNATNVMAPEELAELLARIRADISNRAPTAGTSLPQPYLVHEELQVAERVYDTRELGVYIHTLCDGHETYRLERRKGVAGIQKREAVNCHKIRHFENVFVMETLICEA